MSAPALAGALELLDRALGHTRGALAGVPGVPLDRPTPCAGWTLGDLLAHMDDALDAFAEGGGGAVAVRPPAGSDVVPLPRRFESLHEKACGLLAAWSAAEPDGVVLVGGVPAPVDLVARAAALEITVHGWDVAQATGAGPPLPDTLATALLPTALALVGAPDRRPDPLGGAPRFGAALAVRPDDGAAACLLAHLGRRATGPGGLTSAS